MGKRYSKRFKNDLVSIITNLFILIVSLFIAFLIAELTMRTIGGIRDIDFRLFMKELKNSDRLPEDLLVHDDILVLKLRPDTQVLATTSDFSVIYKMNSKGLRDKEYDYRKSADKIRVLAFGDSNTFGEGVKYGERFTDILELNYPNLEIINLGVPGYGLDQQFLSFLEEGVKYSPDYVILFVSVGVTRRNWANIVRNGTILFDNLTFSNSASDATTIFLSRNNSFYKIKDNFALEKSYILSYINYQIRLFLLKKELEKQDTELWGDISRENKKKKVSNDTDNIQKRTSIIIKKFYEIANENDIPLIVIKIDSYGNLDYIREIENVTYYDLTNDLRNESKKYSLSFKYDPHFNKKTHSFIGRKVTTILAEILKN